MKKTYYLNCLFGFCCLFFLVFGLASPSFALESVSFKNIKFKIHTFSIPDVLGTRQMSISYNGVSHNQKGYSAFPNIGRGQQEGQVVDHSPADSFARQNRHNLNDRIREIKDFLFRYVDIEIPIQEDGSKSVFAQPDRCPANTIVVEFESTPSDLSGGILFVFPL